MNLRINAYDCTNAECRNVLVTREVGECVTPFLMSCPVCSSFAQSRMYQNSEGLEPTHEWYPPRYPERIQDAAMRYHVEQGGWLFRKIGDPDATELLPEPSGPSPSDPRFERHFAGQMEAARLGDVQQQDAHVFVPQNPILWAELKAVANALSPEQLEMPVAIWGLDRPGGVLISASLLEEDQVDACEGAEPASFYAEEENFNDLPVVARKGDPFLLMEFSA